MSNSLGVIGLNSVSLCRERTAQAESENEQARGVWRTGLCLEGGLLSFKTLSPFLLPLYLEP